MDLKNVFIFTEPQQGASYDDLLRVALHAERLGFGGFFRSDHYLKMGGVSGLPGPTDALLTLAGLARDTSTIRLGTLVCSATFRHAGVLAISAAQIDQMSGGRLDLGLGAGWYEQEHTAHAIPFPSLGERFDLLEDQLAIITGMWNTTVGETFSYAGKSLSVADSPGLPKPVQQPGIPLIIGGRGTKRTPRLCAQYGAEFNRAFPADVAEFVDRCERVRAACGVIGRDPSELRYTVALLTAIGSDEAEYQRRAARVGRPPEELHDRGAAGTVGRATAQIRQYAEAGADRIYLQIMDLDDLDHLDLIASEVVPSV